MGRLCHTSKKCYWCGAPSATEVDHVFSANLFLKPRPSNLITVPACSAHNRMFSLDEEYFRDFILGSSYAHPEARKIWQTKTRRTLHKKPSYRAMLAAQLRRVELELQGVFSSVEWMRSSLMQRESTTCFERSLVGCIFTTLMNRWGPSASGLIKSEGIDRCRWLLRPSSKACLQQSTLGTSFTDSPARKTRRGQSQA